MASKQAIQAVWTVCEAAGMKLPWHDRTELARALSTWANLLEPIDDETLARATRDHVLVSVYWPKPSELLRLARQHAPARPPLRRLTEQDTDSPWLRLMWSDPDRGQAVFDRAWQTYVPQVGGIYSGADLRAVAELADQLCLREA